MSDSVYGNDEPLGRPTGLGILSPYYTPSLYRVL